MILFCYLYLFIWYSSGFEK